LIELQGRGNHREKGVFSMQTPRLFGLSIAVFTAGCQSVAGDGTVSSEVRTVGAFRSLSVGSAITASIIPGSRSLTLRADENLLPLIETKVDGDTLVIDLAPGKRIDRFTTLQATITNDVLEGVTASGAAIVTGTATATTDFPLTISGASRTTIDSISSTSVTVDASGASAATLEGAATSAKLTGSGASSIDLRQLPVSTAQLELSGGSQLRAQVSSHVGGSLSGASSATIIGTPTVDVAQSGGSHLELASP